AELAQPPGPSGWLAAELAGLVGAAELLGTAGLLGAVALGELVIDGLPVGELVAAELLVRLITGRSTLVGGDCVQPASASTSSGITSAVRSRIGRQTSGMLTSVDPQIGAVRHLELPGGRA